MNGSQTFSGGAGGDGDDSDGFVDEGETSRSVMPTAAAAIETNGGPQDISDNKTESEDSKVNQALSILGLVCTVLRLCSRYGQ